MDRSESINELAAALAKAQGAIQGAVKDSVNPAFKSKYADLASVWDACRGPLAANGLSIAQLPAVQDDGRVAVTTVLMHLSGQFLSTTFSIRPGKDDAHGIGSAVTYARRFSLAAMVGVAPEDDDGNAAAQKPAQAQAKATPPAGYAEWADNMLAVADTGLDALKKAWTASPDALRTFAPADFNASLKARAQAADAKAKPAGAAA
jgi:hypothetical protein